VSLGWVLCRRWVRPKYVSTAMTMRPAARRYALVSLVALAFAGLVASEAAAEPTAAPKPKVSSVRASCIGDTISGKARVSGPMTVRLALLAKASAKATFKATGKSRSLVARKSGYYPFKFDISRLNAYGYRVQASKQIRSQTLLAAGCGPGHQIPEAPFALLLPLSLLLIIGLPVVLLRRRAHLLDT
jgi:hypothetical protein